ncbi:Ankyrin-2 [Phytophthora citrophthora]|uniref:Ankyrin-2 n=1 Tax=Phytophthora citrophthora TaxID=4793 RepID=A0AAD9GMM8_9STRA|nr:Ankyrin-2 [Phytophthora citrophthora]
MTQYGYEDIVSKIVTNYILDINCTNENGWTALLYAATNNHTSIVKFLINHGASLTARNYQNLQALHLAAAQGFLNTVKVLVEAGADIGSVGMSNMTPFLFTIKHGHFPVVKFLIEWLKSRNEDEKVHELLEVRVYGDWTPLNLAADAGNLDRVIFFTEHDAVLNIKNEHGFSPLHSAVVKDHRDVVKHLISIGADIDTRSTIGVTPLGTAAKHGLTKMAALLLDAGADIHTVNHNGCTPLLTAVTHGHKEVVELLLNRGANLEDRTIEGFTSLIIAAERGDMALIQLFVSRGASINSETYDGATALSIASKQGHIETCRILVDLFGLRGELHFLNAPDIHGRTALHNAVLEGSMELVELLVQYGAAVNTVDYQDATPMNLAIMECNVDIIQYLTAHGAAPFNESNEIWTLAALQQLYVRSFEGYDPYTSDPKWYIDPSTIQHERFLSTHENNITEASYCSWLGAPVIVLENAAMKVPEVIYNLSPKAMELGKEIRYFFAKEVARWFPLNHPHVLKLYGACHSMQQLLVVERVSGETMREYLQKHPEKTWKFLYEVALAIQYLHERGVFHGFIRGDNILVSDSGSAKVGGFGLYSLNFGKKQESTAWESVDSLGGGSTTPEQDVYSLGMCVIEAVTGEPPYAGQEDVHFLISSGVFPERSPKFSDRAWLLVTRMSAFSKRQRLSIDDVLTRHRLSYTPIQPRVFHSACQRIKQLPDVKVEDWFLPPYEVDFNHLDAFNRGGYGSVHHGTWMNTPVVVKKVFAQDASAFEQEVGIWFQLFHPYVVQLFGACHLDGQQFFVCEDAVNGQLDRYLRRHDVNRNRVVWQRLCETAVALQFLHGKGILHRDLKCNNILIGIDGKVKLADFGLSSVISDGDARASGAVRWQAPEIIRGEAACCASDVYSLAMCVLEAVTGEYPWKDNVRDDSVRYSLLEGKAVTRPADFTDEQWKLVKRMTSFQPTERLPLDQAVEIMRGLAEIEAELPDMPIPEEVLPAIAATSDQSERTVGCTSPLSAASSAYASCFDSTSADHFTSSF